MVQSLLHMLVYHKNRSSLLCSSIFSFKISIRTSLVKKIKFADDGTILSVEKDTYELSETIQQEL